MEAGGNQILGPEGNGPAYISPVLFLLESKRGFQTQAHCSWIDPAT